MRGRGTSGSPCSSDVASEPGKVVLNVGCGNAYKPGAVNIDVSRSSVADLLADARSLPFRHGSVDAIEADQLLEHFDNAHVRIVLREFHRVLRPDGELMIETPDIRKALRRLMAAEPSRHSAELQWAYGLDSPGLQHKTGFTKESLRSTLDESSFEVVRFDRPRTHTYEPGMRAVCRRREPTSRREEVVAEALGALSLDKGFDDSFVLVPLQEELARICSRPDDGYAGLLSAACVLNPAVALAIAAALRGEGGAQVKGCVGFINMLAEARFHERAFTLWKKSARGRGGKKEFEEFTDRLAKDVAACLEDGRGDAERLRYVLGLDPTPISLMEHRLAMVQGQKAAGRGVRMYHSGRHELAIESFRDALAIDPSDFSAAMSLARLLANHGKNAADASEAYSRAVGSAPTHLRGAAEREALEYERAGRSPDIPFVPA